MNDQQTMVAPHESVEARLNRIFFPFATEQAQKIKARNGRFVHYTSAESAMKILSSKQFWLRSAKSMNDFMEVEHGFDYLLNFFQMEDNKNRKLFYDVIDDLFPGAAEQAIKLFDQWLPTVRYSTYLACFSEHDDDEDVFGRLSMWRAYGRSSVGVAIVLNNAPFFLDAEGPNIFASPVSYLSEEKFHASLHTIINSMSLEKEFLKTIPREKIVGIIFSMLLFASVCSKHPGFREEREWRVIAVPKIFPSKVLESGVETISGVPQPVYKVPLRDNPQEGLVGVEIPVFLDRIIIGPSSYPLPVFDAFVATLEVAGVAEANSKVVISDIPLRT